MLENVSMSKTSDILERTEYILGWVRLRDAIAWQILMV